MGDRQTSRIFLSYSNQDGQIAEDVYRKLIGVSENVFLAETRLSDTDSIINYLRDKISANDYVIVLVSKNTSQSKWLMDELMNVIDQELKARDVGVIPVLLDYYPAPAYLQEYQPIRLRPDFERGVQKIIDRIRLIPRIHLEDLDGKAFERLIGDLLISLGFKMVERQPFHSDQGFDYKALYSYKDPFGYSITETWLVQTKFYRVSRLDFNTLRAAVSYLLPAPGNYKVLLATNGHLTSASRDWLKTAENKEKTQIRVIEGSAIKTLLMQHESLVEKYFGKDMR